MAALMMARELLVAGLRSAAASRGKVVGANWMGKTKAVLQTACVGTGLGMRTFFAEDSLSTLVTTGVTGLTLLLAWAFAGVFLWWNRALFRRPA